LSTIEASRAIVLGGGIQEVEPGRWEVSASSRMRAEAMLKHYYDNQMLFRRMGAKIVCSGSHGGLALGQEAPPSGNSEAKGIADILVKGGVPHELIVEEGKSISTFSNYEEILKLGLFTKEELFTPEDPLLVVTSKLHGEFRGIPIARAAFGIEGKDGVHLKGAEKEPIATYLREAVGGVATKLALAEAGVTPYSSDDLEIAGKRFAEFTQRPALLLRALARRIAV